MTTHAPTKWRRRAQIPVNTQRRGWENLTPDDATDAELNLVHLIAGQKPHWMDAGQWRLNMRAVARDIRDHVAHMANGDKHGKH